MILMPLVALCADIDLRREPNCNQIIKLHAQVICKFNQNSRILREKEYLNIAVVFATSLSFIVAFFAANRKWERYKMDNYEDHYDMSCPSTIVSHCLSNRANEIAVETSTLTTGSGTRATRDMRKANCWGCRHRPSLECTCRRCRRCHTSGFQGWVLCKLRRGKCKCGLEATERKIRQWSHKPMIL